MASSLSSIADNLTEGIHKTKCKGCVCFLEYKHVKANLIIYKCLSCNKSYSKELNEELKKKLKNTFKFSNSDINKFILLLKKSVYPHEYMDNWEKFNETTLSEKEDFYSNLNPEDITDADYMHAKRVCKDFEIKNLGETMICILRVMYYFSWMFLKTLEKCVFKNLQIRSCKTCFSSWISMAGNFKKAEEKLDILTHIDVLLIV